MLRMPQAGFGTGLRISLPKTQRSASRRVMVSSPNSTEWSLRPVTLRQPEPESKVPLLREAATWSFGQFAVAPEHKGRGFGKQIHDFALLYAAKHGCKKMALHTAQPATALIAMYRSWGYELAGTCDWRPHTNFVSVLMSKPVPAPQPDAAHEPVPPFRSS